MVPFITSDMAKERQKMQDRVLIRNLEDQVEKAWREWQSEESRDRGYNFLVCKGLQKKYQKLKDRLDDLKHSDSP